MAIRGIENSCSTSGVVYDWDFDEKGVRITAAKPPVPDWLREIVGDDFLGTVFQLDATDLTSESGTYISQLGELRELNLTVSGRPLSATAVEFLKRLPRLERVMIVTDRDDRRISTGIDDGALQQIGATVHLKGLFVQLDAAATSAGVTHLARLRELESLHITGRLDSPVSSLPDLSGLKNLRFLELTDLPDLTADSLKSLADRRLLETVRFDRCAHLSISELPLLKSVKAFAMTDCRPIDDADLARLATFVNVESVVLSCPTESGPGPRQTFTDAGLSALEKLPKLRCLDITSYDSTRVTPAAIESLKRAHPGMMIKM